LLVAAVALAVYIGVVERRRDSTEERRRRDRRALRVDPARIRSIQVETEALRVALTGANGQWTMTEPVRAPADVGVVGRILLALERLPKGETITPEDRRRAGTTLSDYGLDPPRARIAVEGDGVNLTLRIGRATPAGDALYIQAQGAAEILTTAPGLLSLLPTRLEQWRDRALYRGEAVRIRRVEVRRPDGVLRLDRGESGGWTVAVPYAARANLPAVAGLLSNLLATRIGDFISNESAEAATMGLDDPAIVVEFTASGLDPSEPLLIGAPRNATPDWYYARFRGREDVFTIPAQLVAQLTAPLENFRDRRLTALEAPEIHSVRLELDDQSLLLTRSESGWMLADPVRAPADPDNVEALIRSWSGALIERFTTAPGAEDEFQPPLGRVGLSRKTIADEDPATLWIRVGRRPPEDGRIRVWTSEDPCVQEVSVRLLSLLTPDPLLYRDRRLFSTAPSSVYRMVLTRGDREQAVRREQDGPFVSEHGGSVDSAALCARLERLLQARARRYVAERPPDLSIYGLDPPEVTLTLGLRDEAGISKTLFVGRSGEHGTFAMIRGRDMVFTVDDATRQDITADLTAGGERGPDAAADSPSPP